MRRSTPLLLALPVTALALAGCATQGMNTSGSAPSAGTPSAAVRTVDVKATAAAHSSARGSRTYGVRGVTSPAPSRYAEGAGRLRRTRHRVRLHRDGPGRGQYVGPARNGRSRCGYQYVGPGLETAMSFTVHGVRCRTAHALARASRGRLVHAPRWRNHGFRCVGTRPRRGALARYRCTRRGAKVTFLIS